MRFLKASSSSVSCCLRFLKASSSSVSCDSFLYRCLLVKCLTLCSFVFLKLLSDVQIIETDRITSSHYALFFRDIHVLQRYSHIAYSSRFSWCSFAFALDHHLLWTTSLVLYFCITTSLPCIALLAWLFGVQLWFGVLIFLSHVYLPWASIFELFTATAPLLELSHSWYHPNWKLKCSDKGGIVRNLWLVI